MAAADSIRRFGLILSGIVIAAGVAFYFFALSGGASSMFSSSYEIFTFETLSHSPDKNAYLACSNPACGTAEGDEVSVLLPAPLATVRALIADTADKDLTKRMLAFDLVKNQFDIGERIPGKPYYGIVAVRLIEYSETQTEMLVYAYQPIGPSTKGDHTLRARELIQNLQALTR